jgi:2-hydroxy-3-keto-5-methylthiopentenyl-1-phosphate phosphatase
VTRSPAPGPVVVCDFDGTIVDRDLGFDALVEAGSIDLLIASAGIDFCIRDTLRAFGLESIELVCPRTEFHPDGLRVRCPPLPASGECEDFKEAAVLALHAGGREVVYVGDGLSDFHAAARAELRFALAGSSLERELTRRELPFVPFADFTEVARSLPAPG